LGDHIEKNEAGGTCSSYGERRVVYRILVRKLKGRDHLEDPGLDGRIILRWIFTKWFWEVWTELMWIRIGTGGGHL